MSLPVLARPAADPPTGALPPIPQPKAPRKSLPTTPTASRLRTPSRPSALPTPHGASSTPEIPRAGSALGRASGIPSTAKTVRKTISIGAFPHPPVPPSRPTTSSSNSDSISEKKRISDGSTSGVTAPLKHKKLPRISTASTGSYRGSQTPSLLNSSGDAKTIPLNTGKRISDAQSSVHSPPHSRSSSANGSYSTSATTFEEGEDDSRGRTKEVEELATESKRNSKGKEIKGNVVVSVRVRPDVGSDKSQADGEWMVDGRRALIAYRGREGGDYHYDNVFGTYDDNSKVYDSTAKRLVRRVMEGYHGTVFAYGMTGTGKTFSMQGTMTSPGVIPLAITDIFSYIRETPQREFLLRVSYLEIYNEKIHDLLAASSSGVGPGAGGQDEIKLREDPKRGVYATPLKEEIVQSPTQLLRVIHRGDLSRRTGTTQYNARSSRSHAVVQIVVESRERVSGSGTIQESKRVGMLPGGVRVSTLSLIDLAGSERAADDKDRRTEGAHINKSLLTLGTVIAKLSTAKDKNGNLVDKDGKHLPYRDSKLTRLLQGALQGNSLVSILCTIQLGSVGSIATAGAHTGETLNTLKFASRAKNNIISHAKRATEEVGSVNAGLLERYRSEIQNLRSQLESQQKKTVDKEEKGIEKEEQVMEKEAEQRHEEQMLEMQLARTALKERIEHLNRLILCSKSTGVNSGNVSALGMHSRLSGGASTDFGPSRSVRSSISQSTLGVTPSFPRHPSIQSLTGAMANGHMSFSAMGAEDAEDFGEFGEGTASLHAQNEALQADLQDKNRYIATLEKRLLQARRSSHSRTSMGFSKPVPENEMANKLAEKDASIADLQRTVAALRSAVRKREMAELTPVESSAELKQTKRLTGHQSNDSKNSNSSTSSKKPNSATSKSPGAVTPVHLLSPEKAPDLRRKSVDEMSKMLDEMIQDKVESGHLIKGRSGSVRVPRQSIQGRAHSRRASASTTTGPGMGMMAASLRESVIAEAPAAL